MPAIALRDDRRRYGEVEPGSSGVQRPELRAVRIPQRTPHVHEELIASISRNEHTEGQEAASLEVQTGSGPDLAPPIPRNQILQGGIQGRVGTLGFCWQAYRADGSRTRRMKMAAIAHQDDRKTNVRAILA